MASNSKKETTSPTRLEKYFGIAWPGWINVLVWTPAFFILFYLTVKDFIPLLIDYNENNKAVQIEVITNNSIDRPTDMTVCLPYHSQELFNIVLELDQEWSLNKTLTCRSPECMAMVNHSWDVWNTSYTIIKDIFDETQDLRSAVAMVIVKKVLTDSDGLEALNIKRSLFNWNQPVVDAVWYFLSRMSQLDEGFLFLGKRELDPTVYSFFGDFNFNYTKIGWVTNQQLDQMKRRVANAVLVNMAAWHDHDDYDINELATKIKIWEKAFCIQLPPNSSRASFTFHAYGSSRTKNQLPVWMRFSSAYPRNPFQIYDDATAIYLTPERLEETALYSTTTVNIKNITKEVVTLIYYIENRVVEKRTGKVDTCNHLNTTLACIAESQLDVTIEHCKCIPFGLRNLLKYELDLPYCNWTAYESCKEILTGNRVIFEATCSAKCIDTYYKWKSEIEATQDTGRDLFFSFTFVGKQVSSFIEFSQVDKLSPQEFLCQVGGLANLYLGIDGFIVCAIAFFFINLIKHWHRLRKLSTAPAEQNLTSMRQVVRRQTNVQTLRNRDNRVQPNIEEDQMAKFAREIRQLKEDVSAGKDNMQALMHDVQTMKETLAIETQKIRQALVSQTKHKRRKNEVAHD